ncbi:hypothetical protein WDW37_19925 [Bdellovibrionota bacterium FG-1]
MKIKLEIYKDLLVLAAQQDVSVRSIEVLFAGFRKLTALKIPWIFVDFSNAELTLDAVKFALISKSKLKGPKIKRVFIVGSIAGLCDAPTMEKALEICQCLEAKILLKKIRLEGEINELKQKKISVEETKAKLTARRATEYGLAAENRQFRRIKKAMEKQITEYQLMTEWLAKHTTASEQLAAAKNLREEVIRTLREAQMI